MPIPESPRRMPAVVCDGVQDTFPFDFLVFEDTDVRVVLFDTDTGLETELVLATDYTVTLNGDQDADPGGDVITNDPPADNFTLTIIGGMPYSQTTALPDGGAYRAEQVELALDRLGVLVQQLKEEIDRCAQVPVSSEDADDLNDAINTLAANLDALLVIVNNISDLLVIAADIADINALAALSAEIATLGAIAADITAVAAIDSEVVTVAGIGAAVTAVAGIAAAVSTVASIAADVSTLAAISANVTTVAGISANVTTVAGISAGVTTVAGISADVTTVAGIDTEVVTLAGLQAEIEALYADLSNLAAKVPRTSATGSAIMPAGTTAQRDGSPAFGYTRANSSLTRMEWWNGTAWAAMGGDTLDTTRIDVASATTVDLTANAPATRHINITGTTTITAFTVAVGLAYFVRFNASLTLTNNASIVTQSGANITTQAGDTCILRATAANTVEVLSYREGRIASQPGSAPLYGARAWANFNGTGTVAIRAAGNIGSVTDNGTGNYRPNLTTAMPDDSYSVVCQWGGTAGITGGRLYDDSSARTTSAFSVLALAAGTPQDCAQVNVAVYR